MDWWCDKCDKSVKHTATWIDEPEKRKELHLDVKLTCTQCNSVDWATHDIYDSHVCSGDGHMCYCNDTAHQHCVECDAICCVDPTYEP